jgi:hypothetical protein
MARRIFGGIKVSPRPNGGAVITLSSATGEAFEIERTADQIAALVAALTPTHEPEVPDAENAPAEKARSKKNA